MQTLLVGLLVLLTYSANSQSQKSLFEMKTAMVINAVDIDHSLAFDPANKGAFIILYLDSLTIETKADSLKKRSQLWQLVINDFVGPKDRSYTKINYIMRDEDDSSHQIGWMIDLDGIRKEEARRGILRRSLTFAERVNVYEEIANLKGKLTLTEKELVIYKEIKGIDYFISQKKESFKLLVSQNLPLALYYVLGDEAEKKQLISLTFYCPDEKHGTILSGSAVYSTHDPDLDFKNFSDRFNSHKKVVNYKNN